MSRVTAAAALATTLHVALSENDDLLVLGETVGRSGGHGGCTKGLLNTFGPTRLIDTPISDRATMGLAVGLALAGKTCVVELSGSGRIPAVFEILAEAVSVANQGEFPLHLVVRVPVGGQAGDRIDRSASECLSTLAGCQVLCPSHASGWVSALTHALASPGVTVLLEPRILCRERLDTTESPTEWTPTELVRAGDHITLVSWGSGVDTAQRAAEALSAENISAAVVSLNQLNPIDEEALGQWVRHTGRVLCIDAPEGGLSSAVLRSTLNEAFLFLESPPASTASSERAVVDAARDAVHY